MYVCASPWHRIVRSPLVLIYICTTDPFHSCSGKLLHTRGIGLKSILQRNAGHVSQGSRSVKEKQVCVWEGTIMSILATTQVLPHSPLLPATHQRIYSWGFPQLRPTGCAAPLHLLHPWDSQWCWCSVSSPCWHQPETAGYPWHHSVHCGAGLGLCVPHPAVTGLPPKGDNM